MSRTADPTRSGDAGGYSAWERLIGPGATQAEQRLIIGVALLGTLAIVVYGLAAMPAWSPLQHLLVASLALDLLGGVVANATSAAKRWYHRSGQSGLDHMKFIALHFLHPLLIAVVFRGGDWVYFLVAYGYLIASSVVILSAPRSLQRPVALTLYLGALAVSLYLLPTPGLAWFLPVFYLKLLVAHLVYETPFPAEVHAHPTGKW